MTTAVIVQARFGSTRLPGKVLRRLGGKTVLANVLERSRAIPGADVVCCAVPDDAGNDPVAAEAERAGVYVFRGPEQDVLARFYGAAVSLRADVVMRITSDCPLLDPVLCGYVLQLRHSADAAFVGINQPRTWPDGLDSEAFPFEWLARAMREAKDPFEREHVCPYIRKHPEARIANLSSPDPTLVRHRWTLDTPADLKFFETLWPHLPAGRAAWDYRRVLEIIETHPEIAAINAGNADHPRLQKVSP